jgi:hypothetical protein
LDGGLKVGGESSEGSSEGVVFFDEA